jgi:hypothetical protein
MPSADDVLVAAIELALTGAEMPQAATLPDGQATGTEFVVVPVTGAAYPRAAITWHEDGKPAVRPAGPTGRLRDCEQALLRAGFRVDYTTEAPGGRLIVWARARTR